MPKTGLLMVILGVIFMNGNCATEEQVWEVESVIINKTSCTLSHLFHKHSLTTLWEYLCWYWECQDKPDPPCP